MKKFVGSILAAALCVNLIAVPVSADWEKAEDGTTKYTDSSGEYVTGWQTIDGKMYYFTKDGTMKTGWLESSSGTKYYLSSDGVLKTGWLKKKSGKRYYFDDSGKMVTGWATIGDNKYYFNKDGTMKTGWLESSSGTKYYLKSTGVLATDCTLSINGVKYSFDKSGKLKTGSSSSTKTTTTTKTTKTKNTEPSEFVVPDFGDSSSKVLSECGIANYSSQSSTGGGTTYYGDVKWAGVESTLFMTFNSKDQLYAYAIYYPATFSEYYALVKSCKSSFGYNYDFDDGKYIWHQGNNIITVSYDDIKAKLFVFNSTYA